MRLKLKLLKQKLSDLRARFVAYIKRLLFPLYLFPLKLFTYSLYYAVKLAVKTVVSLIKVFLETLIFPFRSLKNFLKAALIIALAVYVFASLFVITDYINTHYGWWGKFLCSWDTNQRLKNSVVRIVGGYSEGSGFFIAPNQVLTNFHVIDNEPSPKIIFADGSFATPVKITGDKDADLALLFLENSHPDKVLEFLEPLELHDQEPLTSAGFPLGTELAGEATVLKGNFISFRRSKYMPVGYLQTSLTIVEGMSGGPLVDQCGKVTGVNTLSLAGLSLFIASDQVKELLPKFTDQEVKKIEVDPSLSPEEGVRAFYTYLKARRMEDGFKLLSSEYLQKTDFKEWTNRFTNILDVQIYDIGADLKKKDTVMVKFGTKNWDGEEAESHFYEGSWQTVFEGGVYKMRKSNIKEVFEPNQDWFYLPIMEQKYSPLF